MYVIRWLNCIIRSGADDMTVGQQQVHASFQTPNGSLAGFQDSGFTQQPKHMSPGMVYAFQGRGFT